MLENDARSEIPHTQSNGIPQSLPARSRVSRSGDFSCAGYLLGCLISVGLYGLTRNATNLPLFMGISTFVILESGMGTLKEDGFILISIPAHRHLYYDSYQIRVIAHNLRGHFRPPVKAGQSPNQVLLLEQGPTALK